MARALDLTLLLALGLAGTAVAATPPAFQVTRRSLATVYVNAGRAERIGPGDRFRVVAGERTLGELEVMSVTDHGAACRVVSAVRPIGAGDVVVLQARLKDPKSTTAAAPPASVAPSPGATAAPAVAAPSSPPKAATAATAVNAASARPAVTASPPAPPSSRPGTPSAVTPSAPTTGPATSPPATATAAASPATTAASSSPAAPTAPSAAAKRTAASPTVSPPLAAIAPESMAASPAIASASVARGGPTLTVKYRSASNVYLDAGRARGLSVGDRLQVVAGTSAVAELEVVFLADLSASCRVVSETRPVRAGDVAVLTVRARQGAVAQAGAPAVAPVPVGPSPAASAAGPAGRRPVGPWARLRGSASIGYYRSWDQTETAMDFQERTARLDLGLYDIAGEPLSFTLRARSRHDVRARSLSSRTPKSERADRLYEAALRYEPPSDHHAVEVGRVGLYRFVGVGYLDGAIARLRPLPGLQVGAFAGRVAEIEGLGFNRTGSKYGGFARLAPGGRYSAGAYDVVLAFVRENAEGDVSREYLSLESSFVGSRYTLLQRAELDLNRGWRQETTGKSYQFSNVSLSANLRLRPTAWAFASYDGRRNYRYYQNRLVPEEVFDDLLHQGLRAGVNLGSHLGLGASAGLGMSLKEEDPRHPELSLANAYSVNAGLRHGNLFSSGLAVGIDGSGFSNGYTDGGLLSARLGYRFGAGHMVDLAYGRSRYRLKELEQDRVTQWLRAMGRAELGRRVYLMGDFEYDTGDDLKGPRAFLEIGFFF